MARAVTETFTLNNAWKNLWTQAVADGYVGSPVVKSLTVVNFNSTVAYLHFHTSGSTNPTTAADGLPLSSDVAVAPSAAFSQEDVDLSTTWIHTAGNQSIKYAVQAK
jgi:hypothetical protein